LPSTIVVVVVVVVSMSLRYGNDHSSSLPVPECPALTGHYLPLTSDVNYTLLESVATPTDPSLTSYHHHDNNNNNNSGGSFNVDRFSYVESPLTTRHVHPAVSMDRIASAARCGIVCK